MYKKIESFMEKYFLDFLIPVNFLVILLIYVGFFITRNGSLFSIFNVFVFVPIVFIFIVWSLLVLYPVFAFLCYFFIKHTGLEKNQTDESGLDGSELSSASNILPEDLLSQLAGDLEEIIKIPEATKELLSLKSKSDLLSKDKELSSLGFNDILQNHKILEYLRVMEKYDLTNTFSVEGSDIYTIIFESFEEYPQVNVLYRNFEKLTQINKLEDTELMVTNTSFIQLYKAHLGVLLLSNKGYNNQLNDVFGIENDNISKFVIENFEAFLDNLLSIHKQQEEKLDSDRNDALLRAKYLLSE